MTTELTSKMASLYVGDLHPTITADVLYEKFAPLGKIASIRVCRNRTTGESLGYAYVNYQTMNDAQNALDQINYDILAGRPIRIMWSQNDSSIRKSGAGNVFIKNLLKHIDARLLHDTLSGFGNVLSCKVARDESGESKGFGFVQFESEVSADQCIERLNGMMMDGRKVYVCRFVSRKNREKQSAGVPKRYTNVYIKNIEKYFKDRELYEMFARFGTIISSKVMLNENGSSKGFGFVNFKEPDDAEKAIAELNGKNNAEGKLYYVGCAQKKADRQQELKRKFDVFIKERVHTNLYVKNLNYAIDDSRLHDEFSVFGTITSAKVMMNNGRSKGFGFVCFSSADEANTAMASMNGRVIGNRPLYVSLAERKEDRHARLSSSSLQRNDNTIEQITLDDSSTIDLSPFVYHPPHFDFARRYGNPFIVTPHGTLEGFKPTVAEQYPTYYTVYPCDANQMTRCG